MKRLKPKIQGILTWNDPGPLLFLHVLECVVIMSNYPNPNTNDFDIESPRAGVRVLFFYT